MCDSKTRSDLSQATTNCPFIITEENSRLALIPCVMTTLCTQRTTFKLSKIHWAGDVMNYLLHGSEAETLALSMGNKTWTSGHSLGWELPLPEMPLLSLITLRWGLESCYLDSSHKADHITYIIKDNLTWALKSVTRDFTWTWNFLIENTWGLNVCYFKTVPWISIFPFISWIN